MSDITLRDIFFISQDINKHLGGVDARLATVEAQLRDVREDIRIVNTALETKRKDDDRRFRSLERWKYGIPVSGILGVLALAARPLGLGL